MFDLIPDSMNPLSIAKNKLVDGLGLKNISESLSSFNKSSDKPDIIETLKRNKEESDKTPFKEKFFKFAKLTPAGLLIPDSWTNSSSNNYQEQTSKQLENNQAQTPNSLRRVTELNSVLLNNLDNSFEETEAKINLLKSARLFPKNTEEIIDEPIITPDSEKNNKKLEQILAKKERKKDEAEAKEKVQKVNDNSKIFADILENLLMQNRQSDENIQSLKENQDQVIWYVKTHQAGSGGGLNNGILDRKEGEGFFKGVVKFMIKAYLRWYIMKLAGKALKEAMKATSRKIFGEKDPVKENIKEPKASKTKTDKFEETAKEAKEAKTGTDFQKNRSETKTAKGRGIQTVDDFKKALNEAKALKTTEAARLVNNPACKYIIQGGKYAGKLLKFLAPIVGVYAYFSTGDELYLGEDEDVNPRIKLNFAINEMLNFISLGLLGSDSIWELPVKDLSEFMPEDVRNGTLHDQIDYIDNYVRICIEGTYGQNGIKPDPKVLRSIFARFDEWKEYKLQEERLANGNYTIEDTNKHKELYDQLNVMQEDARTDLLKWNVKTFVNDERSVKEFKEGVYNQRTLEYAKNKINEDWYEKLPDNIIHKEKFKKDEIRDWDYISKLDKSKINYLRNSGNLKESDNVLLDKIYENVGKNKDIYTITNEAIQEQKNLLDYEQNKSIEERDDSRIGYYRENFINLNKRQEYIVKDAYDRNLTDVIKAMEAKEAASASVIDSHEQRLLDLEKIINQANEEKRRAYLKAHPEAAEIFSTNEELDDYIKKNEVDAAVEKAIEKIKKAEEEKEKILKLKDQHNLPNESMPFVTPNLVSTGASSSFSSQFSDVSKYSTQMPRYAVSSKVKNPKSNENPQQNIRTVYKRLRQEGFTHEGAVGLMGNLMVESAGMYANIVQGGMGKTNDEFRDMLDQLVNSDLDKKRLTQLMVSEKSGFRSIGYGLAQWTLGSRKAGLVLKAREKGTSVSDINTQLDWLMDEFNTNFKGLKKYLSETNDIEQATRRVMLEFENPADKSEGRQRERIGHSNGIDDFLKKEGQGQEDKTEVAQSEETQNQTVQTNQQDKNQTAENISNVEVKPDNTQSDNKSVSFTEKVTNFAKNIFYSEGDTTNISTYKNDELTNNYNNNLIEMKVKNESVQPMINNNVNVQEQTKTQQKTGDNSIDGLYGIS